MLRKINCQDLTLNSYANLDQHKIKLDDKQNPIWSFFKILQIAVLKKFYIHKSMWRKATECENTQGFWSDG